MLSPFVASKKLSKPALLALRAAARGDCAWSAARHYYAEKPRVYPAAPDPRLGADRCASRTVGALCRKGLLARNLHFGTAITVDGIEYLARSK